MRAERGAVPLDATLNPWTEAQCVIPRKRHVDVLPGRRRRLRQERHDSRKIVWRCAAGHPGAIKDREETVFVRRRDIRLPARVVASVGGLSTSQS